MKLLLTFVGLNFLATLGVFAQNLSTNAAHPEYFSIDWDRTFGGNQFDDLQRILPAPNGDYLLVGISWSPVSGDKTNIIGGTDYWIVRIDQQGNKVWDKSIGGRYSEYLNDAIVAYDGGYLLGGYSESDASGDKSEDNNGKDDYWVIKIDENGNRVWDNTIGGQENDHLRGLTAAPDGGYLLIGNSESDVSGDKSDNTHGGWVVKIDVNGNILWDRAYGGSLSDAIVAPDGGFLLLGSLSTDYWIVKIDKDGKKLWDKTIGGNNNDNLNTAVATPDGGYFLAGSSNSDASGDKSQDKNSDINYKGDFWIVKIDSDGMIQWEKTIGGKGGDFPFTILPTSDHNYILGGGSDSPLGIDISEDSRGVTDFWLVEIDIQGNILWDKTIGGDSYDALRTIVSTADGGYLLGGYSGSNTSGEKSEDNRGTEEDYWVVKIDAPKVSVVTDLTLINAKTDQDVQALQDGDILVLADLPTPKLNVRANVVGQVESVRLQLQGPLNRYMLDNGNPYTMFGNNGSDYLPGHFLPGDYTLTVTPYSEDDAKGLAGKPLTVHFKVVRYSTITNLTLINAETDQDLQNLQDGDVLYLNDLPTQQLNIRAEVVGRVESVRLQLQGQLNRNMLDNGNPYTLFGNNGSDFLSGRFPQGNYTLTVTPYSEDNAMGQAGTPLQIYFDVVHGYYLDVARQDQTISDKFSPAPEDQSSDTMILEFAEKPMTIYPNPAQTYVDVNMPLLKDQSYHLQMYDIYGRLIQSSSGVGHITESIILEDKPKGIYLIVVESQDLQVVRKLLIDK